MLDCLHQGGVEIVSPSVMNTRDYDPRHDFVPAPVADKMSATAAADAPVEVVFDKAEVAQSLEEMRKTLASQVEKNAELQVQITEVTDPEAKQRLQDTWTRAEQRIARLQTDITSAEEREKADDD